MRYDLLIKGAHVVDPGSGVDEVRSVAISRGRVSAVDWAIPEESAFEVVDASGLYLTPGFVDLHTHIYTGATFWGIAPDPIAARTGVTTWVDAGSAGALNFDGFRDTVARRSLVTVREWLNISCIGLTAHDYELSVPGFIDGSVFELVASANRDIVVGGKVRMGASTVGPTGTFALEEARRALDRLGLPMMVHIAQPPPEPEGFQALLRAGDVVTHCCTAQGMRLVNREGGLRDFAKIWRDRGVLFDVGHGTGSFDFAVAEALVANDLIPDFISSDLHQNSVDGPAYDLPTCVTKWLALGMELTDAIGKVTIGPARYLGMDHEIGSLAVGKRADIALFALESGARTLYDSSWTTRTSIRTLVHHKTYLMGREMKALADVPRPEFLAWKRGGRDDTLRANQLRFNGRVDRGDRA